jgi:hypothetical protein
MLVGKKADGAKEARDWFHEHWIRAAAGEDGTISNMEQLQAANEKMHYNPHVGFNPTTRLQTNLLLQSCKKSCKQQNKSLVAKL